MYRSIHLCSLSNCTSYILINNYIVKHIRLIIIRQKETQLDFDEITMWSVFSFYLSHPCLCAMYVFIYIFYNFRMISSIFSALCIFHPVEYRAGSMLHSDDNYNVFCKHESLFSIYLLVLFILSTFNASSGVFSSEKYRQSMQMV